MYIRATGNISPQKTFGHPLLLSETVIYAGNRLACIEPDYKEIIDTKLIRRMSRIIRMGVAAAMECLQEAKIKVPDAIITGTAYGCLEDTGLFLTKMVEFREELLTPTAFIQSTHNTIGAQIGLMLQCNNYNNAFVHRGFSFESALLDGMLLLKEKEAANVLVGAIDEITNTSHAILSRLGLYKKDGPSSSKGTIAGEGAAFFLLANEPAETDYARLEALSTFYKPAGEEEIKERILTFLAANSIALEEIDLILPGNNGDGKTDKIYRQLSSGIFANNCTATFKGLCGEYPTASSFGLWLAANIIKNRAVPAAIPVSAPTGEIRRVLLYNHYQGIHHSLFLLSAC